MTPARRRVAVRVHPRASHAHAAWQEDVLHVWVTEPAIEGRANRAAVRAVADVLGVPLRSASLVRGEQGRDKVVEVEMPAR
ncbi:MAG TPA: DUF167 domain-containing protein [Candidatus Binatia bacterium]|nr:DUF167 domain-containing protein [Candidatus Binatia bacterium]